MLTFKISRITFLERKKIFELSMDIENFSNLMPKYFRSLQITDKINSEIFVDETLSFLGITQKVQTKHKILEPNIHEIHILSGPLRGSSFIEYYDELDDGTKIEIDVQLKFNGFFKILYLMKLLIEKKINKTMDEFVQSCENRQKISV
jgi:ribosome-associated toxin RatA of RatAB toxin-antitoxin module